MSTQARAVRGFAIVECDGCGEFVSKKTCTKHASQLFCKRCENPPEHMRGGGSLPKTYVAQNFRPLKPLRPRTNPQAKLSSKGGR